MIINKLFETVSRYDAIKAEINELENMAIKTIKAETERENLEKMNKDSA